MKPMTTHAGRLAHIVTLICKDQENAERCLEALAAYGRPDAMSFNCVSYDFGIRPDSMETVYIIERWNDWADLDALLTSKVIPALPLYNELLKRPFDPRLDTTRIELTSSAGS